jgi:carboxypeptidase T
MHTLRLRTALAVSILLANAALFGATVLPSNAAPAQQRVIPTVDPKLILPDAPANDQVAVFRVFVNGPTDTLRLVNGGWDLVEARGPDYLLVVGDAQTKTALEAQGFRVDIDHAIDGAARLLPDQQIGTNTYFGGYRTVAEHYAHLDAVASTYPALARVIDYGDSWRKLNNIANGHDLKAICITANAGSGCALNTVSAKPRFFLMSAIHARELSTAETSYRWIDYLVQNYTSDAEVRMLLDHTELWVVPVANPDGRQIVESGGASPYLQRKNANTSAGACSNPPTASNQFGVDLNRNANFKWGGVGASTVACEQTYRGPSAASEPEQYFLQNLILSLFPDQRGPLDTDAAPATTVGSFVSLHSYSNLVLLPWGWTSAQLAPNDAGLRALAFRMSFFNNYQTGTGPEILYSTSGTTDDWTYGVLGIASFTYEIGPASGTCSGFTPAYTCQDGTFWPLNRQALVYAAKTARQPYALPLGPSAVNVAVSAGTVPQIGSFTLSATLDDNQSGNAAGSVNRPAGQAVAAAEYYIDTPPWAGGVPVAMTATDGAFNATSEAATASVSASALSLGQHTLYVRGRDSVGNWGPVSAVFVNVSNTAPQPVELAPVADSYVRSGQFASSNYGTATTLVVRNASSASNTRWTYLRFDTSSFSGPAGSAKIRVFGRNSASGSITVQAFGVTDTTWSESGLTWNNRPASGATSIASQNVSSTANAVYEFDITAYVNAERAAGRNVISIAFKAGNVTSNNFSINSDENTTSPARLVLAP